MAVLWSTCLSLFLRLASLVHARTATDEVRSMKQGESWTTNGYTMVFEGLTPGIVEGEAIVTTATVGVFENGQRLTTLYPAVQFFDRQQQQATNPAIWHDTPWLRRDLYVIVQGWTDNFQTVSFRAFVNPARLAGVGGRHPVLDCLPSSPCSPTRKNSAPRTVRRQVGVGGYASPGE